MGGGGGSRRKYSRPVPHETYSRSGRDLFTDDCRSLSFTSIVMKPTYELTLARVRDILSVRLEVNNEVTLWNSNGAYCGSIINPRDLIQQLINCIKKGNTYEAKIISAGPPCEVRITISN